jgi:hypothetical protein
MSRRAALVLTAMVIWGAAGAAPALAQDPAGCVGNRLGLDIFKDRTYIRDHETINYFVSVRNDASNACTVSSATVQLQLPDVTGNPSAAFQSLTTNATFARPFPELVFGAFPYVTEFGTAPPQRYTARVSLTNARLRDIPPPYSVLNIDRTLQTLTVQPALTIDKVGSTKGGPAPQTVTYTYTVKNTTVTPPEVPIDDPAASIANVNPTDNTCGPLKLVSGDANADNILQRSETWTYTCVSTFTVPGSYTNIVDVCGDNVIDKISLHYCSPPDNWTVVVTKPQGAVKGASVSQKRCVSLPTHLGLRARELTRVRVHVALNGKNIAGSVVKIRGVGISRSKKTGKNGVVVFRVRAKRSGRLTVSSDHCVPAARISVRPARRVVSPVLPQVTG